MNFLPAGGQGGRETGEAISKRQRRNQSPAFQARVARQARALGINRGSVYYLPKPASIVELEIMRRMDALHLN